MKNYFEFSIVVAIIVLVPLCGIQVVRGYAIKQRLLSKHDRCLKNCTGWTHVDYACVKACLEVESSR